MRHHHDADQPVQKRESRRRRAGQHGRSGPATTSWPRSSPPATRPTSSPCTCRSIPDYQARDLLEPIGDELRAVGVDPARFSAAARKAVTIDGRDLRPALRYLGAAVAHQHELFPQGRAGEGRPADPAAQPRGTARSRPSSSGAPPASPISCSRWPMNGRLTRAISTPACCSRTATRSRPPTRIKLQHARGAAACWRSTRAIYDRNLTTKNLDYAAATSVFLNGGGGVFLVGTWMVSNFDAEAKDPERPLVEGLCGRPLSAGLPGPRRVVRRRA